jgi:hypothetical protein
VDRGLPGEPGRVVDDVVDERRLGAPGDRACLEEKLEIVHVAVLVDREEGGMEAIRARVPGFP